MLIINKTNYAQVIVKGSPISKSNFKLFNSSNRAILPYNSGKYHDRYALYEEEIAYECRVQNPGICLTESLIAILKVYYKSEKRHPDTNNITKSIFDGIEKSGLIINDAQIRRLIIEEFYDKDNPRFELQLFGESSYAMSYDVLPLKISKSPVNYEPPSNKKTSSLHKVVSAKSIEENPIEKTELCQICLKPVDKNNKMSCNGGKDIICKNCLKKLF